MAFIDLKNVRIAGFASGVPKNVVSNLDIQNISDNYEASDFVAVTGVKERRIGPFTVSDLAIPAANQLLSDLNWAKNDVEGLIVVTQHGDYILPATACIMQDLLGFSKECVALDISLGCSGWVYGLMSAVSIMSNGQLKKMLLVSGDARKRVDYDDPLFGYAASVTALEYHEGSEGFKFHFGTDGSGYDAIIIPDGGARNQIFLQAADNQMVDAGRLKTQLNGMDVFSFGISTAPKSIKKLSEHYGFDYLDFDYYVFHQANMKMNNQIVKKLKLDPAKVPSCMYHFGNTSSASIPLTIISQLKDKVEDKTTKFLCCGFGVGLSWGTVAFKTDNLVLSKLVEVEDRVDKQWV